MIQSIFFCKIYILVKQVKYISKGPGIRAKILEKIIQTDLIKPIISTRYDRSKYDQLLTDDVI